MKVFVSNSVLNIFLPLKYEKNLNYYQKIQTGYEVIDMPHVLFLRASQQITCSFFFFCQGFQLNKACISMNMVQAVGKEVTCNQAHIETSYSQQSQF